MKKKEKATKDRPKAPISKRMERLKIGLVSFIVIAVSAASFYTGMSVKDAKVQDLNEQLIKQEAEFDLMVEDRVQQARIETQQEMSKQIEILNKELEEEQVAYQDLAAAMDDLKATYEELMQTVFGPTQNEQTAIPEVQAVSEGDCTVSPENSSPVRGYWMNEIIGPELDLMNCRTRDEIILMWYHNEIPEYSRQRLIDTGRNLMLGRQIVFPCSEEYLKAAILIYCGYKWSAWIAQMGYSHSTFYRDGLGYVLYLTDRGIPWEYGLIVLEFESNFGVGAPGNPWGFISGSSGIEAFCNFASGHTGSVYEFVEWYHNPADRGHATYRTNFNNRMIQIQAFCP